MCVKAKEHARDSVSTRDRAIVREVHSTSHHITGCEAHRFGTLWGAGARWRRHYATSQNSRLSTAQDVQLSKLNRKCVFNRSDRWGKKMKQIVIKMYVCPPKNGLIALQTPRTSRLSTFFTIAR